MTIDSLKTLKQLIKLCRSEGVQSIKVDGIEMHLGAPLQKAYKSQPEVLTDPLANAKVPTPNIYNEVSEDTKIVTDELTDEQLLYYSSRPESFEGQQ